MTDTNQAFDREVADELRRDALGKLWARRGNLIMGAAVAVLLAVAGMQWWQARELKASQAAAAQFMAADVLAREPKTLDEGKKGFEALAAAGSMAGVSAMARLRLAGLSLQSDHPAEALAAFDALGADGTSDVLLRDYARLQAAALRLGDAPFTEMQNRLKDLSAAENTWHDNARELLALAALKAGNFDAARSSYAGILADRQTPPDMARRAQLAMNRIVEYELAVPKTMTAPDAKAAKDAAK